MSLVLMPIDEVVTFDALTHDPDTGSIHDADSAPTYDVFDGTTDTPILATQSMTKRTSKTGNYRGTFTASAANGFVAGHSYNVVVSATVTGSVSLTAITSKWRALVFRAGPSENSAGTPLVDVSRILGTVSAGAAGSVAPDWAHVQSPTSTVALTNTTVSTGQTIASVSGAVASVTGNVGGNVVGNVNGNVVGNVGSVLDISTNATTELTSVPSSTATPLKMIQWLYMRARNRNTQTSGTLIVKANDDATTVGTSTVSDDGTTAVRGKFS